MWKVFSAVIVVLSTGPTEAKKLEQEFLKELALYKKNSSISGVRLADSRGGSSRTVWLRNEELAGLGYGMGCDCRIRREMQHSISVHCNMGANRDDQRY